MKKYKLYLILPILFIGLSGCGKKTEINETRKDFKILLTYDEDKNKEIIAEKKTVRELARELMLEELGINKKAGEYKEVGMSKDNGIFVNSGITDGDGILQLPNLTQNEINDITDNGSEAFYKAKKQEAYKEAVSNRENKMKENEEIIGNAEERLMNKIQGRIDEQENLHRKESDE